MRNKEAFEKWNKEYWDKENDLFHIPMKKVMTEKFQREFNRAAKEGWKASRKQTIREVLDIINKLECDDVCPCTIIGIKALAEEEEK